MKNSKKTKNFNTRGISIFTLLIVLCVLVAPLQLTAQKAEGKKSPCQKEQFEKSSSATLVIKNVTVIDGSGAAAKSDMAIVIKGNRIAEVVPAKNLKPPKNAKIINAEGKYAIPGLWDMHVHLKNSTESALPVFIANGITSIRDMAGGFEQLSDMRRMVETGGIIGPRIKFSGPALESPESIARAKKSGKTENFDLTRIVVAGPEDAPKAIKKLKDLGVDFVKIRTWASPETYFAIIKAAKDADIQIVGHSPENLDPIKVANAGQASFEHGFYPYPLSKYSETEQANIIEAFVKNKAAIVPTLVAWNYQTVPLETAKAIVADNENKIDFRRKYTSPELVEYWGVQLEPLKPKSEESLKGWRGAIDTMAKDVGAMFQKGVRVMPGTDLAAPLVFPGFSLHDELEMFVTKIGMSPMQAIESGTRVPAEFMGMRDCLGTIEKGKIADIVLLDADPLEDIKNTRKIDGVIKGGNYFDRAKLNEILRDTEHHLLSSFWQKQETPVSPAGRIIPAMAFDENRNVIVLFGGDRIRSTPTGDTWEYDGKNWKQINPENSPEARYGHQMIFDRRGGKILMFGGYDKKNKLFNDTWTWDGRVWEKIADSSPMPRRSPAIAYDESRGKIVLFGGLGGDGPPRQNEQFYQDTWEFDGKKWERIASTGPDPRYGPAMIYDPSSKKIILFGGNDHSDNIYGDTWEWDGKTWKKLSDAGVNPRSTFKLIYSKKRNSILLFGGFDKDNIYGDVWEWKNNAWQKLDVPEMPKLFFPGAAFDTKRNALFMFGQSSAQSEGETWELDLSKIESAKNVDTNTTKSAFVIDGTLSESEWKDAKQIELTGGGEAFYKFVGDELFVGVRGAGDGWITVYSTDGNDVYALHASAALGTAVYKNENGNWQNTQKFKYEARDASMSAEAVKMREEFYKTNGWTANVGRMGRPNEREFKISNKFLKDKKMKIVIVYSADTKPISLQFFPKTLSDDTLNMELIIGNTPPNLKFDLENWAVIEP